MDSRLKYLCAGVVASLALAGCAPDVPASVPADDAAEQTVEQDAAADDQDAPAESGPVLSDDDVIATMTCEPLTEEQLGSLGVFGVFDRGARVEIGEVEGVTWWTVVLERTGGGSAVEARRCFITRSESLDDFSEGSFIELPDENPWRNVDWDHDMLVRGQSALMLARRTLADS